MSLWGWLFDAVVSKCHLTLKPLAVGRNRLNCGTWYLYKIAFGVIQCFGLVETNSCVNLQLLLLTADIKQSVKVLGHLVFSYHVGPAVVVAVNFYISSFGTISALNMVSSPRRRNIGIKPKLCMVK